MAESDDDTGYIGPRGPQKTRIRPLGPKKRYVEIAVIPKMIKSRIGRIDALGPKKRYVEIAATPEMIESCIGRIDALGLKKRRARGLLKR